MLGSKSEILTGATGTRLSLALPSVTARVTLVEELDGVYDARLRARANESRSNLHHATRIPARDELGVRRRDVRQFPIEHAIRRLGLNEIVDPGAAAADVALGQR